MRGLILKDLDLGANSRKLGQNVIFDKANVARLARYLYALRIDKITQEDGKGVMIRVKLKKWKT